MALIAKVYFFSLSINATKVKTKVIINIASNIDIFNTTGEIIKSGEIGNVSDIQNKEVYFQLDNSIKEKIASQKKSLKFSSTSFHASSSFAASACAAEEAASAFICI